MLLQPAVMHTLTFRICLLKEPTQWLFQAGHKHSNNPVGKSQFAESKLFSVQQAVTKCLKSILVNEGCPCWVGSATNKFFLEVVLNKFSFMLCVTYQLEVYLPDFFPQVLSS